MSSSNTYYSDRVDCGVMKSQTLSTVGSSKLAGSTLVAANGAVAVTGTLSVSGASTSSDISSGYSNAVTPVRNTLDVGAVGSAGQYTWIRVGNCVTLSGQISPTFTAGSTPGTVNIDLPVASNFGATQDASGVVSSPTGKVVGSIAADATNDELYLELQSSATGSQTLTFHATYRII